MSKDQITKVFFCPKKEIGTCLSTQEAIGRSSVQVPWSDLIFEKFFSGLFSKEGCVGKTGAGKSNDGLVCDGVGERWSEYRDVQEVGLRAFSDDRTWEREKEVQVQLLDIWPGRWKCQ